MLFGLVGKSLVHSFSKNYFTNKFKEEKLPYHYLNFEIPNLGEFPALLRKYPELKGLNITIPYKEKILPFLDELSEEALEIGAVNTIVIAKNRLTGYNTDVHGFEKSLLPLLKDHHRKALILGTGGASRAIGFVLQGLNIPYKKVSRKPDVETIGYSEASEIMNEYHLIVNTTPTGTYPDIEKMPALQLEKVSENHLFYDLIYNPEKTMWLKEAEKRGATIKNGYEMLILQAEKSWEIWNAQ